MTPEYDPTVPSGMCGPTPLSEHVEKQGFEPETLRSPGVYAIRCCQPDDPGEAWDEVFENRPPYLPSIEDAAEVIYVGAASDIYARLEDHTEGGVRQTALMRVCPPHNLVSVWTFEDAETAFTRESGIAMDLQHRHPEWYVHSR